MAQELTMATVNQKMPLTGQLRRLSFHMKTIK